MAERIVSPGVFTNEVDRSFLPAAISNLGAALIGVCEKGPAFIPTVVNTYTDFKLKFGGLNPNYYLPYTAKSYLKNAGTATIVRVLGGSGYSTTNSILLKSAGTGGSYSTGSLTIGAMTEYDDFTITGSDNVAVKFIGVSGSIITNGDVVNTSTVRYFKAEGAIADTMASGAAAVNAGPSAITSLYTAVSGSGNSKIEFSGSSVGTSADGKNIIGTGAFGSGEGMLGGVNATNAAVYTAIFPTSSGQSFSGHVLSGTANINAFQINWGGGDLSPTMSLQSSDSNYVVNVLGSGTSPSHDYPGYVYTIFKHTSDNATGTDTLSLTGTKNQSYGGYTAAVTPSILSQTGSDGNGTSLFKLTSLSDGDASNQEIKIAIANIKKPGSIAGSDYGSFDVIVRNFDDTDKRPEAVESFNGCNLDPDSVNYVVRRIGDQVKSFSSTTQKVSITGDYANKSKYIRVSNIHADIKNGRSSDLYPFGFGSYLYPILAGASDTVVPLPIRLNQSASGEYNSKLYHGIAFDSGSTSISGYNKDILPYLGPVATNSAISSSVFGLDKDCSITIDSSIGTKKFILGLQNGRDGFDPRFFGGTNSDGDYWGLGKAQASDSGSFKDAIAAIANPDEIDINMLVVPGADSKIHSEIVVKSRDTIEDRSDAFYVYDAGDWDSTNADVITAVETIDSNYSSTYWPWVKIFDDENNKHVWVPPSVVVPGVIAFTDKVSHPWFAPAGLNRGGLTEVVMAKDRLTHAERDDLYDGRVNPIATFPGEGVVIWGQKTLQAKPSALDRVNVRRLLIKVKKFIASSSRYLVFEQNTEATRQRFLNIVNPFLESVQSNSGLTSFRVVMDETNNTPDVIDRNQMNGQIFIQPARTAEFIVLDFVVLPTGAAFPE